MPWQTRLTTAAYTSPSGERFEFVYENVSRSIEKRTTGYDFPNVAGTFVQDFGRSGRKYPMRLIINGSDHDITADRFFAALGETGAGLLEHPRYGVVSAVPFGSITQRDDLKTAGNQTVIELTFWETLGISEISATENAQGVIAEALDNFIDAIAGNFSSVLDGLSVADRASLSGTFSRILDTTNAALAPIAGATASVESRFLDIYDSVNSGIDQLISDPLTLGQQAVQLIQTPARSAASIRARLDAYGALATGLIGGTAPSSKGTAATQDIYATSYVSGLVAAATYQPTGSVSPTTESASSLASGTVFATRNEALAVADEIFTVFEDVAQWRDEQFEAQGIVDTGEGYQALQTMVGLTAGFLVDISFTLKQERRIVLDRARNIVELLGELYGAVESEIDFFINSNDLSGSEILELPEGREIVYYV